MAEGKRGGLKEVVSPDYELLSRIRSAMADLSPAKQKLAQYVIEHVEEAAFISARELGRRAGYSEPVAVRLATDLKFDGYGQFQKALQEVLRHRLWRLMQGNVERNREADSGSLLAEVYQNELENLSRTLRSNDVRSFHRAADLVMQADWVAVMGSRASLPTAGAGATARRVRNRVLSSKRPNRLQNNSTRRRKCLTAAGARGRLVACIGSRAGEIEG